MKKIASNIPLVIISGLMIYSLYTVATSEIGFSYEHYVGLSLILLSVVFLRLKPLVSKLATLLALFLGTFSQAAYTPIISRYRLGFTIGGIGLGILIQFYCLLLLIIFVTLNWGFLRKMRKKNESN